MNLGPVDRLFKSAKAQAAVVTAVATGLILFNVPMDVQTKTLAFVAALWGLAAVLIGTIAYEDAAEKKAGGKPLKIADLEVGVKVNPETKDTSRIGSLILLLALLIPATLMTPGCTTWAAQPTQRTPADEAIDRVTRVQLAYIVATTPIEVAIARGDIKGDTAKALRIAMESADSYLEAAYKAAKEGRALTADEKLQEFLKLRKMVIDIYATTQPPATQPGVP